MRPFPVRLFASCGRQALTARISTLPSLCRSSRWRNLQIVVSSGAAFHARVNSRGLRCTMRTCAAACRTCACTAKDPRSAISRCILALRGARSGQRPGQCARAICLRKFASRGRTGLGNSGRLFDRGSISSGVLQMGPAYRLGHEKRLSRMDVASRSAP